jgi:hypothetical protein
MTHLFVHYHLRPGGVTRVLQQEAAEFSEQGIPFVTLSAGPASVMGEHREISWLDYAIEDPFAEMDLWAAVEDLPRPLIWHIHNPTLGYHPEMATMVHRLALAQERIILHIHDFAEDGRKENLRRLSQGPPWFPIGARIHYVVLTRRDRDILCHAGLPDSQVTIVGNPVMPHPLPVGAREKIRVLYPTRAITRKNMGELLLLASLAPAGTTFATTLGPGLSRHQEKYGHWQQIAKNLALPIEWAIAETGNPPPTLTDCVAECTHLITTSTQEGFGMTFLESIAWQRPLIGRAIPHIQENLSEAGIAHPFLYEGIFVDGIDFVKQSTAEQTRLLQHARLQTESVQVLQNNKYIDARQWLHEALSPKHQALPLSLLEPFHPKRHGESISRIAQSLREAPESVISHLDADSIRRSFSA